LSKLSAVLAAMRSQETSLEQTVPTPLVAQVGRILSFVIFDERKEECLIYIFW
jgi:hypothetical protein